MIILVTGGNLKKVVSKKIIFKNLATSLFEGGGRLAGRVPSSPYPPTPLLLPPPPHPGQSVDAALNYWKSSKTPEEFAEVLALHKIIL